MSDTARQLAYQAKRAKEATSRRNELIRQMHAEGSSLRSVAEVAGLSHAAVRKILTKLESPVAAL